MSNLTKSAGKPKSAGKGTPKRGSIAGKKRGKTSSAGASARPAKKPKKTVAVVGNTYATTFANVARNLFGPTYDETALELQTKTLRAHKDLVKGRYENCKNLLAISRSRNSELEEKLACTEQELSEKMSFIRSQTNASIQLANEVGDLRKTNEKLIQTNKVLERNEAALKEETRIKIEHAARLVQAWEEKNKKLEKRVSRLEEAASRKKAAERIARMLE